MEFWSISIMRSLFALLFSMMIGNAYAFIGSISYVCVHDGREICNMAKAMEHLFSQSLPLQMNDMVTMESVSARMANVHFRLRLDKVKGDELREALASLPDQGESIKALVVERIVRNGCSDEHNAYFVSSGGTLTYQFLYADDELFSSVRVSTCKLD
jgi:hypothetical protein